MKTSVKYFSLAVGP